MSYKNEYKIFVIKGKERKMKDDVAIYLEDRNENCEKEEKIDRHRGSIEQEVIRVSEEICK